MEAFDLNQLVRPNILEMEAYASARDEFSGEANIFLDANESPFNTGLNRYPDPYQKALKTAIAELRGIPEESIFLGNGSDEAIDLIFRIFCEPGKDKAMLLPPTYGMFKVSAAINNVATIEVPLKEDFQPDTAGIFENDVVGCKLLFICSPNNPTGNSISPVKLEFLLENFEGIVVVDEAYADFSNKPKASSLLSQYPNLIVLNTFSKAWGLAALRLGAAFASPEIVALLNKVKPPYNINGITQRIALEAINNNEQKNDWVKLILEQRALVEELLLTCPVVEKIYPSDANFLLVKVAGAKKVYNNLMEQKIIVRDRSNVVLCDNCLRITIGTLEENMELITALKGIQ